MNPRCIMKAIIIQGETNSVSISDMLFTYYELPYNRFGNDWLWDIWDTAV